MWQVEVKDWEKVNDTLYNTFLSESEKRLKEVIDDSEKITNRAYSVINILIPVITLIIGFLLSRIDMKPDYKMFGATLFLIPLLYSFYQFISLIKKREIYRNGTEPSEIFLSKYVDDERLEENEKSKRILLFIIEQNQEKIRLNEESNSIRIQKYQYSIGTLFVAFILFIVIIVLKTIFLQ